MKKSEIRQDIGLIAACGLYCGSCNKLRKGKCPGCRDNEKASWCKIRTCCIEKGIDNCSLCKEYPDTKKCSKYNNLVARAIEFVFITDRSLCIEKIKTEGNDKFVQIMSDNGWVSMPKKK
jgi:hypothetical protein